MRVREVKSFDNEDSPDTRTIGIELSGDTLVSATTYGGKAINVTIHQLDSDDLYKLIANLVRIHAEMG